MWWCSESDWGKRDAWSQLHKFCLRHDPELVDKIQLFLHPNQIVGQLPEMRRQTALHLAASNGAVRSMDWLKKLGADIEAEDDDARRPIHLAAEQAQPEAMQRLIKWGADISAEDKDGCTAAHYAAGTGHTKSLHVLLQANASLTSADLQGRLPIHKAAMQGGLTSVEWFFKNGIGGVPWEQSLEVADDEGLRPMHFGAIGGLAPVISWLAHKGASVEVTFVVWILLSGAQEPDKQKRTPLHLALDGEIRCKGVSPRLTEVVTSLVHLRADVNAKDSFGRTPLSLAQESRHTELVKIMNRPLGGDSQTASGEQQRIMTQFGLDQDLIRQLKKDFDAIDSDGSGMIDARELTQLLHRQRKLLPSVTEVQAVVRQFDQNKDSKVSFAEYVSTLAGMKAFGNHQRYKKDHSGPQKLQGRAEKHQGRAKVCTAQSKAFFVNEPAPILKPAGKPAFSSEANLSKRAEIMAGLENTLTTWLVKDSSLPSMLTDEGLLGRAALCATQRNESKNPQENKTMGGPELETALYGTGMESFLRWLCFPQMRGSTTIASRFAHFCSTGILNLRSLITAAQYFLEENPDKGQETMNAATKLSSLELDDFIRAEAPKDSQSTTYTPLDELQIVSTIMDLGDLGKSDGELNINEMKTHLVAYPPFAHFVDWFIRPRVDAEHSGRYSKFSLIDDGSGQIDEDEMLQAVKGYLQEMEQNEPMQIQRVLDLTGKHQKDRARKRYLYRASRVKLAITNVKDELKAQILHRKKQARQQDGTLPSLRSSLGLFVPRISKNSFEGTHIGALSTLQRLCADTGGPPALQTQLDDAISWCNSQSSADEKSSKAEVPQSHLLCRISAKVLGEMASLLERDLVYAAAQQVAKLRTACSRYKAGRLVTPMVPVRAFTRHEGEDAQHFSREDASQIAQGVLAVGDQGNGDGMLTQNELSMYLSRSPFAHFIEWLIYGRPEGSKFQQYDAAGAGELGESGLCAAAVEYLEEMGQVAPSAAILMVQQARQLQNHGGSTLPACACVQNLLTQCCSGWLNRWACDVLATEAEQSRMICVATQSQRVRNFLKPYSLRSRSASPTPEVSEQEVAWRRKQKSVSVETPCLSELPRSKSLDRGRTAPQQPRPKKRNPHRPASQPVAAPVPDPLAPVRPPSRQHQIGLGLSSIDWAQTSSGWKTGDTQAAWRKSSASPENIRGREIVGLSSMEQGKGKHHHAARPTNNHMHVKSKVHERVNKGRPEDTCSKMRMLCQLLDYGDNKMLSCPANEMRQAFNRMDTDGNQLLSADELAVALRNLGEKSWSSVEAHELFSSIDRTGRGQCTYDDFVAAVSEYKAFASTANQLVVAMQSGRSLFGVKMRSLNDFFRAIDRDQEGLITFNELTTAVQRLGIQMSSASLKVLFNALDEDCSGSIDVEEFGRTLTLHATAHRQREAIRQGEYGSKYLGERHDKVSVHRTRAAHNEQERRKVISQMMGSLRRLYAAGASAKKDTSGSLIKSNVNDMRAAFQVVDGNNSGVIKQDEFQEALSNFGIKDEEASQLFHAIDIGKQGISYEGFVAALSKFKSYAAALQNMADAVHAERELYGNKIHRLQDMFLAMSDRGMHSDGQINFTDLSEALTRLGIALSAADQQMVFEGLDMDGSGLVSIQEFVEVMTTMTNSE